MLLALEQTGLSGASSFLLVLADGPELRLRRPYLIEHLLDFEMNGLSPLDLSLLSSLLESYFFDFHFFEGSQAAPPLFTYNLHINFRERKCFLAEAGNERKTPVLDAAGELLSHLFQLRKFLGNTLAFTFNPSSLAELQTGDDVDQDSAQSTNKEAPKPKPLAGLKVLAADDSADNRLLIQVVLSRRGAIVTPAEDGREAVEAAQKEDFDVILMDIQMPGMDGYEATHFLRQAGYKKPIIALTAHAMAEERERTRAAGCDAHLTKPLDFAELVTTLEKLCPRLQQPPS